MIDKELYRKVTAFTGQAYYLILTVVGTCAMLESPYIGAAIVSTAAIWNFSRKYHS
jgi:hypothetical protein